jgi:hypothetical protein
MGFETKNLGKSSYEFAGKVYSVKQHDRSGVRSSGLSRS